MRMFFLIRTCVPISAFLWIFVFVKMQQHFSFTELTTWRVINEMELFSDCLEESIRKNLQA